jgi:hypothetical protein
MGTDRENEKFGEADEPHGAIVVAARSAQLVVPTIVSVAAGTTAGLIGALVLATATIAVGGPNALRWIEGKRARRLFQKLARDRELSAWEFRQHWGSGDKDARRRELRNNLESIDREIDDEVADSLINVLLYRSKEGADVEFADNATKLLRGMRAAQLATLRDLIRAALAVRPPTSELALRIVDGSVVVTDPPENPPTPLVREFVPPGDEALPPRAPTAPRSLGKFEARAVRTVFRRLREADLGQLAGAVEGAFFFDATPSVASSPDDSVTIRRVAMERLAKLIQ